MLWAARPLRQGETIRKRLFYKEVLNRMDCPQLPGDQSLVLGQKRLAKAAEALGQDVLVRLIVFVLYILGFQRSYLADLFGYEVSGIKTLVDRVLDNKIEGFFDHRRFQPAEKQPVSITRVGDFQEIRVLEKIILVPDGDLLAKKIITVTLAEADMLSNREAADILGYTPQAFGRLRERYRQHGSTGLIDQRQGQKMDYKVTSEVKAELIYQICANAAEGKPFTSHDIWNALNEIFPEKGISPRTIRYYLNKLGVSLIMDRLVKKN